MSEPERTRRGPHSRRPGRCTCTSTASTRPTSLSSSPPRRALVNPAACWRVPTTVGPARMGYSAPGRGHPRGNGAAAMPSTGPTVFSGPPSVIAQISLESEAFRIAALSSARAAVSTRPTGSPAPGSASPDAQAEDVAATIERVHLPVSVASTPSSASPAIHPGTISPSSKFWPHSSASIPAINGHPPGPALSHRSGQRGLT